MTSYNIAVTVGPNIFRPMAVRPADLFNAGTYYDVVIRLMENFEILFEDAPVPNADDFDLLAQADSFSQKDKLQQSDRNNGGGRVGANMDAYQLRKAMGTSNQIISTTNANNLDAGMNNKDQKADESHDMIAEVFGAAAGQLALTNDGENEQRKFNKSQNRKNKQFAAGAVELDVQPDPHSVLLDPDQI